MIDLETARILIQVTAGVVKDLVMPEFTRQYTITSKHWENPVEVLNIYNNAFEYARLLMNPRKVNWVKLHWIYL